MAMGRPSEYRPEYVKRVFEMAERGATDVEIADSFDVCTRTLYRWKAENPDFGYALKVAKEVADDRVERSLYQLALGYERDAVKIFMNKDGETIEHRYREYVPPHPTAQIFWLKNRKREQWRDRQETEHSGTVGIKRVIVPEREPAKTAEQPVAPEFE